MFRRSISEITNPVLATLSPDEPLAAALSLMREKNTSCALALSGGKVEGILTERDVVRAVANAIDPSSPLRSVMSQPVNGILKSLSVEDACRMVTEAHIRHLAVMDHNGALMGYVGASNLVDALAVEFMVENILCSEVMNPRVVAVSPNVPLIEAIRVMDQRAIGSVVAAVDGKPAGLVSERDVVRRAAGNPDLLAAPVSGFMSRPVICVPPEGMIYKIILYMKQKQIRRTLVVNGTGLILGILTLSDMVKFHPRFL